MLVWLFLLYSNCVLPLMSDIPVFVSTFTLRMHRFFHSMPNYYIHAKNVSLSFCLCAIYDDRDTLNLLTIKYSV